MNMKFFSILILLGSVSAMAYIVSTNEIGQFMSLFIIAVATIVVLVVRKKS